MDLGNRSPTAPDLPVPTLRASHRLRRRRLAGPAAEPTTVLRHHSLPRLDSQAQADPQQLANLRCAYRDHNGQNRYCRISARPILFEGKHNGFRGTASDITDEVDAHARIQHLSMHDALTGLANRNKLARHRTGAAAWQRRAATDFAVVGSGQLQADQRRPWPCRWRCRAAGSRHAPARYHPRR